MADVARRNPLDYHTPRPVARGWWSGLALACGALAGAGYLLAVLGAQRYMPSTPGIFWSIAVAFVIGVPAAAGAAVSRAWAGFIARPVRTEDVIAMLLAGLAIVIYIAFWIIVRATF